MKIKYYETAMQMMVKNRKHVFDMMEKGLISQNVVSTIPLPCMASKFVIIL